ncbi:helix-turn-helix domain-containing protein [Vibrio owensii]|uniref:helix-turn-helix domain-containing protein n=1 Tax=Vibrio owensii TaxID=696485 RepID=UPI0033965DCB
MSISDKVQIIEKDGGPAFAVLPYGDYLALMEKAKQPTIPLEVVRMKLSGDSSIKAWRRHLGISQSELADKMGVTQATISNQEKVKNPHDATIKRMAEVLGLDPKQLKD